MAEWVKSAQDVSDEQMQSLWGRILAGEVAAGGSFSRRALAAVRLLSKEEANTFTRFCSFVWWIDGLACSVQDPNAEAMLDTARVSYGSREVLRSIGLVTSAVTEFYNLKRDREYTLEYFDTEIRGRLGPGSGHLLVIALTPVGGELARIAGGVRSDEYFKLCLDHFRNNGLEVGPAPQLEGARLTRD
jgi:hypothetical protein